MRINVMALCVRTDRAVAPFVFGGDHVHAVDCKFRVAIPVSSWRYSSAGEDTRLVLARGLNGRTGVQLRRDRGRPSFMLSDLPGCQGRTLAADGQATDPGVQNNDIVRAGGRAGGVPARLFMDSPDSLVAKMCPSMPQN